MFPDNVPSPTSPDFTSLVSALVYVDLNSCLNAVWIVANLPDWVTVTHTKVVVVAEVVAATTMAVHIVSRVKNAFNLIF